MIPIIGLPTNNFPKVLEWAEAHNSAQHWINEVIPAIWCESWIVDPVVLVAQASHETGFGHYGRALTENHRNVAGIKVSHPVGPDANPDDHARFASWMLGARAHRQHLLAYCGIHPSDYSEVVVSPRIRWLDMNDPIRYVEELGGKWAPSTSYGEKIVEFINEIVN